MGNEQSFVQTKKKKLREIERKEREDKLEEIAQVEFESKLAEGTTATCYKGIWKQKEVAIKQFKEEGEITQFTKELSILRKVGHHSHIVNYLTCNERKRFIVLEFVLNGTLFDLFQSDHILQWPDRFSIANDIVHALLFLHNNGICHADLRSSNLLVTNFSPYKVKLFDFSSSRLLNDPEINEGDWLGDLRWQPPEVCTRRTNKMLQSPIEYPLKVDVYSFGVVLFELATGKIPFSDLVENSMIARSIIEGDRPKLPENIPGTHFSIL